ncbi:MAG: hypothetical protein LBT40_02655 [Deltaproteobacteria bacterium]|nr:hypothetical protein [Deltaproteobacteria bacterium]
MSGRIRDGIGREGRGRRRGGREAGTAPGGPGRGGACDRAGGGPYSGRHEAGSGGFALAGAKLPAGPGQARCWERAGSGLASGRPRSGLARCREQGIRPDRGGEGPPAGRQP